MGSAIANVGGRDEMTITNAIDFTGRAYLADASQMNCHRFSNGDWHLSRRCLITIPALWFDALIPHFVAPGTHTSATVGMISNW